MKFAPPEKPVIHPPCSVEGCPNPGEFKAPKSRYQTGEYQYFCLDHIREFNRAWDYFDGWERPQIESFMQDAAYGHRPTWKIGSQPTFTNDTLRDSFFKMLGEEPPVQSKRRAPRMPRKDREALAMLNLEPGADLLMIKTSYKKLVKKYHPDVNRGNKNSEELFKQVTAAYGHLSKIYGTMDEK